jgi:uncharacterized OsmC-like protein
MQSSGAQGGLAMKETATTRLNDVDIAKMSGLIEKLREVPDMGASKWAAEVTWKGGFRSEAKIRSFDPVTSDEPAQLGGTNAGPNPVEQVLGALGNCLAVGYAANATAAGIEIRDMTLVVEGDLDLHVFLGLKDGHAGFSGIKVRVDIASDATPEALKALHDKVLATSPVGHTLTRAVPLDVSLGAHPSEG